MANTPLKSKLKSPRRLDGIDRRQSRTSLVVSKYLNSNSTSSLSKSLRIKDNMREEGITFSDEVACKRITRIRNSVIDDLFYTDEEIAEFRNQAFMEDCGLNASDFD